MKKITETLKANKTVLIIISLILALIFIVVIMNGGQSESVYSAKTMTQTEEKLTRILNSIDGVGNTEVMVTETEDGICGVVIVCEGANNLMVRGNVLNAASTALNISKNIIAIYAMN